MNETQSSCWMKHSIMILRSIDFQGLLKSCSISFTSIKGVGGFGRNIKIISTLISNWEVIGIVPKG